MNVVLIHRYASTAINALSLLLNAVLLRLVVNYSRFEKKQFKWLFMMTCVGGAALSAVLLFSQPYLVFGGGYMFLVSNGFFSCRSGFVDQFSMGVFCALLHVNIIIVVMQFVWRNSITCGDRAVVKVKPATFIFPATWCGIQALTSFWCWTFGQEGLRDKGNEILKELGWPMDNVTAPYPSMTDAMAFKTVVHHVFYLTSSVVGYSIIIRCQYGVVKFLGQLGMPTLARTHKANNEVKRVLFVLALVPLSSIFPPESIMIVSNALNSPLGFEISGYLSLIMTAIALVNPLATIYLVRSYRDGFLLMLGMRKKSIITPSATSVGGSTLEPASRIPATKAQETAVSTSTSA